MSEALQGLWSAIKGDLGTISNSILRTAAIPGNIINKGYQPTIEDVMAFSGMVGGGGLLSPRPKGSLGMGGTIKGQKGSGSTQVATTGGSYEKAAKALGIKETDEVLDYGAGMGHGADVMRKSKANVETLELHPEKWNSEIPVTYTNSKQINKKFDKIVSMNVLNVLEPELRTNVLLDIAHKLKLGGGKAIIGTRGFKGDISQSKKFTKAKETGAYWINKKEGPVYQKGFDGDELVNYAKSVLSDGFVVKRVTGIAKAGIEITRK